MQLKVKDFTFPEAIEFNFEELEAILQEKMTKYTGRIYTAGQMAEAKKDLADLRKFVKVMSDERIRIKKEYLKPYEEFEAKIKKLDAIVQEPIAQIDSQVKSYENETKKIKRKQIAAFFEDNSPFEWLKFEQLFDEKWLNVSVKMPAIEQAIEERFEQIKTDLETLSGLPEFSFEATEVYKDTLDINKAISEGKRLAEIQERKTGAEQSIEESVQSMTDAYLRKAWISFSALLSIEDALALKQFFNDRNIEFKKI